MDDCLSRLHLLLDCQLGARPGRRSCCRLTSPNPAVYTRMAGDTVQQWRRARRNRGGVGTRPSHGLSCLARLAGARAGRFAWAKAQLMDHLD